MAPKKCFVLKSTNYLDVLLVGMFEIFSKIYKKCIHGSEPNTAAPVFRVYSLPETVVYYIIFLFSIRPKLEL